MLHCTILFLKMVLEQLVHILLQISSGIPMNKCWNHAWAWLHVFALATRGLCPPLHWCKLYLKLQVKEQRLSGLLQSMLVFACLAITPIIQKIPKSVLWGYFAYMAIESLPGSEFWDRILLLLTDPKKRYNMLENVHSPYLETVPYHVIVQFTILQICCMVVVYAITWAGVSEWKCVCSRLFAALEKNYTVSCILLAFYAGGWNIFPFRNHVADSHSTVRNA